NRVRIGEVVQEEQTLNAPVTHDEVTIERHSVDRQPAQGAIGERDETIQVPVRAEQVSVHKQTVVTEEVSIGKQQVQETKQVSGTVRREEARVEGEGEIDIDRRR
ncbi:MAG TPA: YsnF/AvaK domain-containing protein, partial [Reyranella sp.]|nr:YsnF/AvaK domain-containing protein [Reyranella sp.]